MHMHACALDQRLEQAIPEWRNIPRELVCLCVLLVSRSNPHNDAWVKKMNESCHIRSSNHACIYVCSLLHVLPRNVSAYAWHPVHVYAVRFTLFNALRSLYQVSYSFIKFRKTVTNGHTTNLMILYMEQSQINVNICIMLHSNK
jgi:hypothetical protein